MVQIVGKYTHVKNENLDEYFKAVGVPFIPRKMMLSTSPVLDIKQDGEDWTITISTMLRTNVLNFKLGEEYTETMPGGTLTNITTLEGDTLKTSSIGPNETKLTRTYEFNDEGCIIIMRLEDKGLEARRYFKRA